MIDWHDIDTVLLDMDGTLLDLHYDNYFWLTHLPLRYAEIHGVPEAEARQHLHGLVKKLEGTLQWYCLQHWSDLLEVDVRTLKEEVRHKIRVRPHVDAFLANLRQSGKRVVLVTNAHPDSLDLKMDVTGLAAALDRLISSHEYAAPKESADFWRQLQDAEPFDPERTLFVDDTVRILAAADRFGIRHLLCMHQPDSEGEHRQIEDYPAIHHFDEIMPIPHG